MAKRTTPPCDHEIIDAMRSDDVDDGLYWLYKTYAPRTREFLLRRGMAEADVDDVLQVALIRAWQNRNAFDSLKGTIGGWFHVVCLRRAADVVRENRQRREADLQEFELEQSDQEMPSEEQLQLWARVTQAIELLRGYQKYIVIQDLIAGGRADNGELAKSLNTTMNSIRVSRNKARKKLAQYLRADCVDCSSEETHDE